MSRRLRRHPKTGQAGAWKQLKIKSELLEKLQKSA
jgi:hypothetical protein